MTRRCPACGQELPAQAVRFCVRCGQTLAGEEESPATPTQAAQQSPASTPGPHARAPRRPPPGGLIIAITVLVVLAAAGSAAFVLMSHHRGQGVSAGFKAGENVPTTAPAGDAPPSPSPAVSSAQAELAQITPLIEQSVSARNLVVNATQQVGGCTMAPADGINLMNQAINQRQRIIDGIDTLSADTIPGGQQLLADLKEASQQSIAADQGFIGWMQDIQSSASCPIDTSQDSSYQTGLQASTQAVQAKQAFTGLWNPLASQFGQPTFTPDQL